MGIFLIILVILLVCLNNDLFPRKGKKIYCIDQPITTEPFLGQYAPSFNSNSRGNDYYYDKTGMKGTLFHLESKKKYELPEEVKHKNDIRKAVKDLEIYPETFYAKCESDFDYDSLEKMPVKIHNDYLNTYLNFNKGVLIRNNCGRKHCN